MSQQQPLLGTVLKPLLEQLPKLRGTRIRSSLPAEFPQTLVIPFAQYSPWHADPEFLAAYQATRGKTLVDVYRCWELWTLIGQAARSPGQAIEVGVWKGGTGYLIAKALQAAAPDRTLYLCDTFQGVVKAGPEDTLYRGGEHADASRGEVEALLASAQLRNTRILEGVFPDATGSGIESEQFCFCHVDVDAYRSAADVTEWVWSRLAVNGLVVFDDYGFNGCEGVTRFVNEFAARADVLKIHNLNGHAILVKLAARA